jgi:NAD(P)-dependent dehydrogenase (short-subunit alcohol dehydrogenase family)
MSAFNPSEEALASLKNQVVVVTGGATGIGAALVSQLHKLGADVVFGDINEAAAEELVSSCAGNVTFVPMNVTSYADNVKLFRTAYEKYGRVDHGVAVAGIAPKEGWFDFGSMDGLSPEEMMKEVERKPEEAVLKV